MQLNEFFMYSNGELFDYTDSRIHSRIQIEAFRAKFKLAKI